MTAFNFTHVGYKQDTDFMTAEWRSCLFNSYLKSWKASDLLGVS